MSEPQKIRLTLSPQAEKYARRDAPVEARRMAAGGALPLEPVELATVLFALTHDPEPEVKDRARRSLEELPEEVARTVMTGETHPAVLGWLAHAHKDDAQRTEWLALNAATDDRTFAFLATLPHKRVVEIVANNQQRMLRHPPIVDALGDNPLTGRATIDRILNFLGLERPHEETPAEEASEEESSEEVTDEQAASALKALLSDDASGLAEELLRDAEEEPEEEAEEKKQNLYSLVQTMNVMQKVKLARMGNKEARGLLVRDRNKIVASAAVRSPKLTENEVEGFAKARNVCDEVLRIIASNREWTRNYSVKHALATNPKCPIPTAMKFLNFLQDRDLKSIMKSREVPAPVSGHARRILQKKGKL